MQKYNRLSLSLSLYTPCKSNNISILIVWMMKQNLHKLRTLEWSTIFCKCIKTDIGAVQRINDYLFHSNSIPSVMCLCFSLAMCLCLHLILIQKVKLHKQKDESLIVIQTHESLKGRASKHHNTWINTLKMHAWRTVEELIVLNTKLICFFVLVTLSNMKKNDNSCYYQP